MKKYTSSESSHQGIQTPAWDSYPYGPEYIRAGQIARSPRNFRPLIDISLATWWRWVKSGEAPQPIRLSRGTTVWRLREVISFAEGRNVK
jgi:predicted DNA-binding transcriptional regulator AlpA